MRSHSSTSSTIIYESQTIYIYIYVVCKECIGMCVKKNGDPEDREEYLGISLEVDINFLRVTSMGDTTIVEAIRI